MHDRTCIRTDGDWKCGGACRHYDDLAVAATMAERDELLRENARLRSRIAELEAEIEGDRQNSRYMSE